MKVKDPNLPQSRKTDALIRIGHFLHDRFSLDEDKDDEVGIIQSINRGIEFRGINLWTLIFAIFIASIGRCPANS